MPAPAQKLSQYVEEVESRRVRGESLVPERAEFIIADLRRDLRAGLPPLLAANTHVLIGLVYDVLDRGEEALAEHRKASNLDPFNATHVHNVGGLLVKLKRFDEALDFLARAADLAGKDGFHALAVLAVALRALGHDAEARGAWADARELVDLSSESQLHLFAHLTASAGFEADAVELFARYVALVLQIDRGSDSPGTVLRRLPVGTVVLEPLRGAILAAVAEEDEAAELHVAIGEQDVAAFRETSILRWRANRECLGKPT